MNVLSGKNYKSDPRNNENLDHNTFGDIFALSVISLYTFSALVISGWSAILWFTGNTNSGSPIGFIFNKIIWPMIA